MRGSPRRSRSNICLCDAFGRPRRRCHADPDFPSHDIRLRAGGAFGDPEPAPDAAQFRVAICVAMARRRRHRWLACARARIRSAISCTRSPINARSSASPFRRSAKSRRATRSASCAARSSRCRNRCFCARARSPRPTALARIRARDGRASSDPLERLHRLMAAIHETIVYDADERADFKAERLRLSPCGAPGRRASRISSSPARATSAFPRVMSAATRAARGAGAAGPVRLGGSRGASARLGRVRRGPRSMRRRAVRARRGRLRFAGRGAVSRLPIGRRRRDDR